MLIWPGERSGKDKELQIIKEYWLVEDKQSPSGKCTPIGYPALKTNIQATFTYYLKYITYILYSNMSNHLYI